MEQAFENQDNILLIKELLKLDLFPIKDSYIAFLKCDSSSIERNPKTINRICGRLYEMGLDKIFEKCTEPKETNRQIGPFFHRWLNKKALGIQLVSLEEFTNSDKDAILIGIGTIDRAKKAYQYLSNDKESHKSKLAIFSFEDNDAITIEKICKQVL